MIGYIGILYGFMVDTFWLKENITAFEILGVIVILAMNILVICCAKKKEQQPEPSDAVDKVESK